MKRKTLWLIAAVGCFVAGLLIVWIFLEAARDLEEEPSQVPRRCESNADCARGEICDRIVVRCFAPPCPVIKLCKKRKEAE